MLNPITKHARQRMQQRDIQRIARELGRDRYRELEKWLATCVVVGADDAIVTVAHRHRRLLH